MKNQSYPLLLLLTVLSSIVATNSLSNVLAQEYDDSYYNDENNYIPYDDKYKNKNSNTLVLKKVLLICEEISENSTVDCSTDDFLMENPNSGKYVECNPDLCNPVTPNLFGISIQDKLVVEGNTEGTTIDLDKEYYYVSEDEDTPNQF